jgi:hypothetical protein
MKTTFSYVEDYIEFLGGYRDAAGTLYGLFNQTQPPINLARYDVNLVTSLASQTSESRISYTDRQAEIARRIVSKYKKQLGNLPTPVVAPTIDEPLGFRMSIRQIDRRRRVYLEDNKFILKFPFDSELINALKKHLKDGQGSGKWNEDDKTWSLGITESTLNWLLAVKETYNIEISDDIQVLAQSLLKCEQISYKIELILQDQKLVITNAAASLLEYIEQKLGGLSLDNLIKLVDNSSILGYTVSDELLQRLNIDSDIKNWLVNKQIKLEKSLEEEQALDKVIEYARLTDRLPVYLYQGQSRIRIENNNEQLIYLDRDSDPKLEPRLLVTTTAFMIGHKRARWLQSAEKIAIINNASDTTN